MRPDETDMDLLGWAVSVIEEIEPRNRIAAPNLDLEMGLHVTSTGL